MGLCALAAALVGAAVVAPLPWTTSRGVTESSVVLPDGSEVTRANVAEATEDFRSLIEAANSSAEWDRGVDPSVDAAVHRFVVGEREPRVSAEMLGWREWEGRTWVTLRVVASASHADGVVSATADVVSLRVAREETGWSVDRSVVVADPMMSSPPDHASLRFPPWAWALGVSLFGVVMLCSVVVLARGASAPVRSRGLVGVAVALFVAGVVCLMWPSGDWRGTPAAAVAAGSPPAELAPWVLGAESDPSGAVAYGEALRVSLAGMSLLAAAAAAALAGWSIDGGRGRRLGDGAEDVGPEAGVGAGTVATPLP